LGVEGRKKKRQKKKQGQIDGGKNAGQTIAVRSDHLKRTQRQKGFFPKNALE